jgi:adenosylmethionine-8-amino-7-oxononanoate aminotransferase
MNSILNGAFDTLPEPDQSAARRLSSVGKVRRARDFFLYREDGRRLVDLWQCGGAALLGHKPPNVVRALKNTCEKGLFAPFPSSDEDRLVRALSGLFPGRAFRFFNTEEALRGYFAGVRTIPLFRPLLESDAIEPPSDNAAFAFIIPFPLAPLVAVTPLEYGTEGNGELAPAIAAASARALYDLAACEETRQHGQNGIYKRQTLRGSAYSAFFSRALESGFLLPPNENAPIILPPVLSKGLERKLRELLATDAVV